MPFLAGYRPITTRRIGQAPTSSVMPINSLNKASEEAVELEEDHLPPEHGFSAFEHYAPQEVLLEDFSTQRDVATVHPLDPPRPISAMEQLHCFEVKFRPAHLLTLGRPSRLHAHGQEYEFSGFLLLTQYAFRMPEIQLLCGGEVITVELTPTEPPAALRSDRDEHRALGDLHRLLYGELLGLPKFMADARSEEAEAVSRAEAAVKRVRVTEPSHAEASMIAAEMMAEVAVDDEAWRAGKRPKPASAKEAWAGHVPLFSRAAPSVPEILGPRGEGDGLVSEPSANAVTLNLSNLPLAASDEEIEACLMPFRALAGTLRRFDPPPHPDGTPATTNMGTGSIDVADPAAALEALSSTIRVGQIHNEAHLQRIVVVLPPPVDALPSRKLVVSGLGVGHSSDDLTSYFGEYGELTGPAQVFGSHTDGRVRFALIEYVGLDNAADAVSVDARQQHINRLGVSTRVTLARPQVRTPDGGAAFTAETRPTDAELQAGRAAAWGTLEAEAERRWAREARARFEGGLVARVASDGASPPQLWRTDSLSLEYFAAGGLPLWERLASPCAAAAVPWEPLLAHSTQLGSLSRPTPAAGQRGGGAADGVDDERRPPTSLGLGTLLLLCSECELLPIKSDVTQQALTIPSIVHQMLWFARAEKLQAALGVAFSDLNLLRRAFVHPSYGDRPEVREAGVGRALSRVGTLGAQRRLRLRDSLRSKGLRRMATRMDKQPLAKDAVMSAGVEHHNQRLEFLGDALLEFLSSHHLFCLLPNDEEGTLTDARTGMVNNRLLAQFTLRLGLHAFSLLGERTTDGRAFWHDEPEQYEKMLADLFEAFLGAVYLDRGLGPARNLFAQALFPRRSDLPLRRCWLQAAQQPYQPPDQLTRDLQSEEQAPLLAFERATSLVFTRFGLLRQAFTHPSYFAPRAGYTPPPTADGQKSLPHNQRLEYLGDAVLQLASSDYLFHHFPEHQEGQLSLLRSSLVNNSLICDVAATCGMHHCMRFFHDTMDGPGRARRGMLADCFEAFIGALFLDRQPLGMAYAKAFTHTMLFSLTRRSVEERRWMDPKMRLQFCLTEFNSANNQTLPPLVKKFGVLDEWGPSHEKMYLVGCYINGVLVAQARGQSFADGQMGAALRAAEALHIDEETQRGGGKAEEGDDRGARPSTESPTEVVQGDEQSRMAAAESSASPGGERAGEGSSIMLGSVVVDDDGAALPMSSAPPQ